MTESGGYCPQGHGEWSADKCGVCDAAVVASSPRSAPVVTPRTRASSTIIKEPAPEVTLVRLAGKRQVGNGSVGDAVAGAFISWGIGFICIFIALIVTMNTSAYDEVSGAATFFYVVGGVAALVGWVFAYVAVSNAARRFDAIHDAITG